MKAAQVARKRKGTLMIGGCGYVGHLLAPVTLRNFGPFATFDKRRCAPCPWRPNQGEVNQLGAPGLMGDVTDLSALYHAMKGIDAVVYAAEGDVDDPRDLFDVAVFGVYNALTAARARGVRRFVLLSSLSVFSEENGCIGGVSDFGEDAPPQCDHPDGASVLNSEWWCRYFAETFGMSCIVLRISGPKSDDLVRAFRALSASRPDREPDAFDTAATDLSAAIGRAIALEPHTGFDVVNITGDLTGCRVNLDKAKRLLGWEPTI